MWRQRNTLRSIVNSQNYKIGYFGLGGLSVVSCLPFSWLVTSLCLYLNLSANVITLLRAVIFLVGMFLVISFPHHQSVGYGLALFCIILDSVDGQICRVTNSASHLGKLLDGWVDMTVEFVLPMTVALSLFINTGSADWLMLGLLSMFANSFHWMLLLRTSLAERFLPTQVVQKHPRYGKFLVLLNDARFFLLISLLGFLSEQMVLIMYAALNVMAFVVSVIYLSFFALSNFNIPRISRSQRYNDN